MIRARRAKTAVKAILAFVQYLASGFGAAVGSENRLVLSLGMGLSSTGVGAMTAVSYDRICNGMLAVSIQYNQADVGVIDT